MKKILFLSNTHLGTVQVLSDLRWFGKNKELITDMTNDHIRNCRIWLHGKINAYVGAGYPLPIENGYTYKQWFVILHDEELRRENLIIAAQVQKIEDLKLQTLSTVAKKKMAAKLLEKPTSENVIKAEKLLGL